MQYVARLKALAKVQRVNPTCDFYSGVQIAGSNFGDYVAVFHNTIIINSTIGSHSYIQKNAFLNNATVGKFCSIAGGAFIAPGIHQVAGVSSHPAFYLKNTPLPKIFADNDMVSVEEPVEIGHDVWIGQNAVVMDGVKIGTGAIVAAGAVVTRNVPPYTIVGGVPAKVIRKRFDEDTIAGLLDSAWWDRDDQWLKAHHKLFLDPRKFLEELS